MATQPDEQDSDDETVVFQDERDESKISIKTPFQEFVSCGAYRFINSILDAIDAFVFFRQLNAMSVKTDGLTLSNPRRHGVFNQPKHATQIKLCHRVKIDHRFETFPDVVLAATLLSPSQDRRSHLIPAEIEKAKKKLLKLANDYEDVFDMKDLEAVEVQQKVRETGHSNPIDSVVSDLEFSNANKLIGYFASSCCPEIV